MSTKQLARQRDPGLAPRSQNPPHYHAHQNSAGEWGFTTPTGWTYGFLTEGAARKAAAATERQDLDEAQTGTGPVAAVLRTFFAGESKEPDAPAADFAAEVGLMGQDDHLPTPFVDKAEFEAFIWSDEFGDFVSAGKVVRAEVARSFERKARKEVA